MFVEMFEMEIVEKRGTSCRRLLSQTKILECRTNLSECVFEALFKGVSTVFGLQIAEKCFENTFWKVCSTFQNLRLGSINSQWFSPKSSTHALEKYLENAPATFCSVFQNLRLGSIIVWVVYPSQTKVLDGRTNVSECFSVWRTKIAQFRTHYWAKESPYVTTQQSGQDTMYTKMI